MARLTRLAADWIRPRRMSVPRSVELDRPSPVAAMRSSTQLIDARQSIEPDACAQSADRCDSAAADAALPEQSSCSRNAVRRPREVLDECSTMASRNADRGTKQTNAQTHRHLLDPRHRRRPDRHRPGVRVRLFGHPGDQGAEGGGLSGRPGQFEPGDDHDRSRAGRRDLCRADHARDRRQDHREGAARRGAADDGRADRAQHRAGAVQRRHAREIRRAR